MNMHIRHNLFDMREDTNFKSFNLSGPSVYFLFCVLIKRESWKARVIIKR